MDGFRKWYWFWFWFCGKPFNRLLDRRRGNEMKQVHPFGSCQKAVGAAAASHASAGANDIAR